MISFALDHVAPWSVDVRMIVARLPQVAATAAMHFVVEKEVIQGRTRSRLFAVQGETRIQELVRMLGGGGDQVRAMAASLLQPAD